MTAPKLVIRAGWIAAALAVGGCSYEWGAATPALRLVGSPPAEGYRKLNAAPAGSASVMTGPDGTPWAAFCEFRSGGRRACQRFHLSRLGRAERGATTEEFVTAGSFTLRPHALFALRDDPQAQTRTVAIHRPGDGSAEVAFVMPAGRAILYPDDGLNQTFVYWRLDSATTHFDVFRRDRRYQRTLAVPPGADPANPGANMDFLLTADGDTVVVHAPDRSFTAYSTLDEGRVDLGVGPADFFIDEDRHQLVVIGKSMAAVPLEGGAVTVIDPATSDLDLSTLALDLAGNAWYVKHGDLFRAPLDGSAAPVVAQPGAQRLLALGPQGAIAYSKDTGDRYAAGAGDGWLGNWNFMERGVDARFNASGTRIHFAEHAADVGGIGDLTSVTPPDGAKITLARNVNRWEELPGDRVLAVENRAQPGNWARLVLIDEAARTARWLAAGAENFTRVPGEAEILVDVVSGATGYDIVRVPLP